jgi:hypothetical protein
LSRSKRGLNVLSLRRALTRSLVYVYSAFSRGDVALQAISGTHPKTYFGTKTSEKAMVKASPLLNTYLSHRLTTAQDFLMTVSFDIYIKEILPTDNRSAFVMLGTIKDKKGGPNSTGKERFVFLGFENAAEEGHINLFAREGSTKWAEKTIVAGGLKLGQWYTITIEANVPEGFYTTAVEGVIEPFELESFYTKGSTPDKITHISFASWNDGAGTFYVDNVSAQDQ